MRYCIHDVAETITCAFCDQADRELRSKEQNVIADLRAENARLHELVATVADILETWMLHAAEQDARIFKLQTVLSDMGRSIKPQESSK